MQTPVALHRCVYKALCGCYSEVYPLVDTFIDCEINSEILKGKNMSMISELIVRLRKLSDQWRQNDVAGCDLIDDAIDTIEALSAKVRNNNLYGGWIPVSERLPEDNREVLISIDWGVDIGQYDSGEWRSEWINHYDDDNVRAWMPLPKRYKE